jgi:hypothetical protein
MIFGMAISLKNSCVVVVIAYIMKKAK